MKQLLLRVHAKPGEKLILEGKRPIGYFQDFGVTIENEEELVRLIRDFVTDDTGGNVLEIDDVAVADLDGKHLAIRDVCSDPAIRGIWYVGGRAFYSDDDEVEKL